MHKIIPIRTPNKCDERFCTKRLESKVIKENKLQLRLKE